MKICLIGKDGVQEYAEETNLKEAPTTCVRRGSVYIYRVAKSNNRQWTYQRVSSFTCLN